MGACLGRRTAVLALFGVLGTVAGAQEITSPDAGFVPGRLVVELKGGVTARRGREVARLAGARVAGEVPQIGLLVLELPAGVADEAQAAALRSRPEVERAELDRRVAPCQLPDDPHYASSPAQLLQIRAPEAWSLSTGSDQVIVAVLDSGIDTDHEDLAPKLVPGWNAYDGNSNVSDVFGHGTYVAGVAAAATDNATGVASIGWSSRLMPIRVTGHDGYATTSAIAAGLVWAADHGARVANLSFDLSCCQGALTSASQYFQERGGVVVSAAGNNGGNFLDLPDHPYILAVSAAELDDSRAWWSSYGSFVDLAAPKQALSTGDGGGYVSAGGTSIASPYVAGVAALVVAANPSLTGSQIQDVLKQSAHDHGPAGWDPETGWGRVDAAQAVQLALQAPDGGSGGGGSDGEPDGEPPTVQILDPLHGSRVRGSTLVRVDVEDESGVERVELYVDGLLTESASSGDFALRWQSSRSRRGPHVLQCKAYDTAGNVGASQRITVFR